MPIDLADAVKQAVPQFILVRGEDMIANGPQEFAVEILNQIQPGAGLGAEHVLEPTGPGFQIGHGFQGHVRWMASQDQPDDALFRKMSVEVLEKRDELPDSVVGLHARQNFAPPQVQGRYQMKLAASLMEMRLSYDLPRPAAGFPELFGPFRMTGFLQVQTQKLIVHSSTA